jgi:SWIM zinc finger
MKAHASATNPQQTIHRAAETLCFQAEVKELTTKNSLIRKEGSKKLWSSLPTADKLTDFGEGLLREQWLTSASYKICGPMENKWLVLYNHWNGNQIESSKEPSTSNESLVSVSGKTSIESPVSVSNVPKFWRIRVVERCKQSNTLTCSCCYFERVGIPCRHILKVLRTVHGNGFNGVTENDVRVFWRKRYYKCAVDNGSDEDNVIIRQMFFRLLDNDTRGPRLDVDLDSLPVIMDDDIVAKSALPVHERCFNYSKEICLRVLPQQSLSIGPANLTQESMFNNDDDGWCPAVLAPPSPLQDTSHAKRAYCTLHPAWQECIGKVSANEDPELIQFALEGIYELNSKIDQKLALQQPAGKVVSSCVAANKRHRSHGTDHRKIY